MMNKKINAIIQTYLKNHNKTDYAIMINGKWGCGKTFYVENELKDLVENNEAKYIYISMNGCSNFTKIANKITLRLLFKNNYFSKDDGLMDNLYELGVGLSKFHLGTKVIFESLDRLKILIEKPIIEKLMKELNPSKIVIIFDDIERISNNDLRNDYIGLIYENYTKKGYKTILVGDETNIDDVKYNIIKEKVIRRTITYEPEKKIFLKSFIDNQFSYSNYREYLDANKMIDYIIAANITNLRTISFVIDNFIYVLNKLDDKMKGRFDDSIFINILIITNEYKSGKITIDDLVNKKDLSNYPSVYYMNDALRKRGTVIARTYLDEFHEKYITIPAFSDFKFIGELFNFILTGYLDIKKLDSELKSIFYDDFIPESERVFNNLIHNLAKIEEDELLKDLNAFISYLKEGRYNIAKLPYIYSLLKLIQKKNFVADWNYNIEEILNNIISESEKNIDIVPDNIDDIMFRHKYSDFGVDQNFYNSLCEKINKLSESKRIETDNVIIKKLFDNLISNEKQFYQELYSNNKLFHDIVKTQSEHLFFNLSNKGIRIFESFIRNNPHKFDDAVDAAFGEKTALKHIINYLESNIYAHSEKLNHLRIVRLKELIQLMKDTVEYFGN